MLNNRLLLKRILLCLAIGIALSAAVSELSFLFLREVDRDPQVIVLTIPPGTADLVARGEQPPSIPEDMIFIVGDVLIVKNEDSAPHELGPLFIPSGSSAHLAFDTAEGYAYSCSFQPDKALGLDVREPVTPYTRFTGILFGGLPLGGLIALYSLVARPIKKEEPAS
jgi:hypothetical protein